MTIEIKFTGNDPQAIAREILTIGFLFSQKANAPAEPVADTAAVEAEPVDEPKKPRGRPRKVEPQTIEGEKADAEPAGDADGAVAETGDGPGNAGADGSGAEAHDDKAEVDAVADKPAEPEAEMTVDDLRKYTLDEYLLKHFDGLDAQKGEFQALLKKFGVAKIGDLAKDKIGAFKAEVDKRIAAK